VAALAAHPCDLVAVAGGDGTVSHASCALAGHGIPLAILPFGTANNTALTLGVEGDVSVLVRSWARRSLRDFDLMRVNGPEPVSRCSEAIGWGVFPDVIARAQELSSPDEPQRTLERDRELFRFIIERAEPRPFELEIDGDVVRGDYLLVEVLNIPFIGPRLELCRRSDPSDGKLEVVLAEKTERAALLELARNGSIDVGAELRARTAKRITVRSSNGSHHRDGILVRDASGPREWSIAVEPAAVTYLSGEVPTHSSRSITPSPGGK
jgi:diacylglycerol kinase family enzyme